MEAQAPKRVWRQQLDAAMTEAMESFAVKAPPHLVIPLAIEKAKLVLERYGQSASTLTVYYDAYRNPSLYWTLGGSVVEELNALEDQALRESGDKDASHRLGLSLGEAFERVWISLKVAEVSGWRFRLQNRLVPCYRSCTQQKLEPTLFPQALANSIKDLMQAAGVERFDVVLTGDVVWLTMPTGSVDKLAKAFDEPKLPQLPHRQAEVRKPKYYVLENQGLDASPPPKKDYETISLPRSGNETLVGWRKDLWDRLNSVTSVNTGDVLAVCTLLDKAIANVMARANVTNYQVRLSETDYLIDCPAGTTEALSNLDIKGYHIDVIDLKASFNPSIDPNFTQELFTREKAPSWLRDFVEPHVDPNFSREALMEKVEQSKQILRAAYKKMKDRCATDDFLKQEAARKEAQRAALAVLRDDWDNLPDADEPETSIIPRPKVNK